MIFGGTEEDNHEGLPYGRLGVGCFRGNCRWVRREEGKMGSRMRGSKRGEGVKTKMDSGFRRNDVCCGDT